MCVSLRSVFDLHFISLSLTLLHFPLPVSLQEEKGFITRGTGTLEFHRMEFNSPEIETAINGANILH